MTRIRTLILSALALGSILAPASPASAAAFACDGSPDAPIVGPVTVSAGAYCVLNDDDAATTVTVAAGGFLAVNNTTVGSIDARGGVKITNSTVSGPTLLAGIADTSTICGSVLGPVTLHRNTGAVLLAPTVCRSGSLIRGNLIVTGNSFVAIDRSTVTGDLACRSNTPAPTVTNVTVRGTRLGQCR